MIREAASTTFGTEARYRFPYQLSADLLQPLCGRQFCRQPFLLQDRISVGGARRFNSARSAQRFLSMHAGAQWAEGPAWS